MLLQPVQRSVDGSGRDVAAGALLDQGPDPPPVGVLAEAKEAEEQELLELTESLHAGVDRMVYYSVVFEEGG